ncbi:MAG TPA: 16S rRNA (guanine(527)-N(7))-methyltransferase RsmG [Spirochaetota bacterium]|nr:16S rRNA (guanine(527)-N(7))-methyltransferase RsmG [Spirochaetota bacterium]HOR44423.1 16S rRNA (guanine(527)-N(7))-methyltransferase RsmG [Spirochaetota bacterium]HOU84608.1 16S rRNA (guanine(527)-N(7))-methyltransferase RsmG [Spirochaetota bacterium]HPK55886.1 16S rRNA (guanine(527)-N(7))-methyltransferase RsmG [Spirochaetota bacterium]HQE57646.1 16S rRNA (guanine(527)-N(7))-methyltransferase RsmG [Spirochaetota bacterium]
MEQLELNSFLTDKGFSSESCDRLEMYLSLIDDASKKFNLTGYKTREDMRRGLVYDSILPMADLCVPRGTSFVDIGTGSGVPGVVLCALFPFLNGVLVDSNNKKIDFISESALKLGLTNLTAVSSRGEEFSSSKKNKEKFDFCVTKAFGPLYYSAEFAAPVLKEKGFLYIYSHLSEEVLSHVLKIHFSNVGLFPGSIAERNAAGISDKGLFWIKKNKTPSCYPRKFPVIKREASKTPETIPSE